MPEMIKAADDDCISSIAFERGLLRDTIWNHADNADLKESRKDPNILHGGDSVSVPDKRIKTVDAATETRHRFRKKGVKEKLRLILQDFSGKARSGVSYVITIDGDSFEGTTGSDGLIERAIAPNAREGLLRLRETEGETVFALSIGGLDPITETTGVQMRLRNLGYYNGAIDGLMTERTQDAIADFQDRQGLEPTGELNDDIRGRIKRAHRS